MKFENFIGITPNAITDDLCSKYVKWFDTLSESNITLSCSEQGIMRRRDRKDESISIPQQIPENMFPGEWNGELWGNLNKCVGKYYTEYDIDTPVTSHYYKIHRVHPSGGYHVWHHEYDFAAPYRVLAWMVVLEAPERGGETEFLHQSIRVDPKVGQLTIWPAGFTHKHRGNPPLEGQKTYMTGWFEFLDQ
jgi:hypothetical protein